MSGSRLYDEIGNFTAVPNWAIEMGDKIGTDGLVLLMALRYHSGVNGEVFPAYDLLQVHTGLTRRRIALAIRKLEELKIIERQKRFGQSTIYRLKNLLTPTSSTPPVLMDEPPVVQQMDCISTPPVLSVVQQVHTNKTHLTRLKEQDSKESSSSEDDAARVFTAWQNGISFLNPTLTEKVGNLIDDYPCDWVLSAIDAAVEHNARTYAYVAAVLDGYKRNGYKADIRYKADKLITRIDPGTGKIL